MLKIEASGASFSPCSDRFVTAGYRKGLSPLEQLEQLQNIPQLTGLPILYPLEYESLSFLKKKLADIGKKAGTIALENYIDPIWKNGSFTNRDPAIRKKAVRLTKESMDVCAELNGEDVLLWLAHDGFDYPFEDDYETKWNWLLEGLSECCEYRSDIKLSLEYKAKEPRTLQYLPNAGSALLLCNELKYDNIGVVVDVGHSLLAGENPAQAVALCAHYGKLFHMHMNDNHGTWDDDMMVGGVHFWEFVELFYVLNNVGYDGWYAIDIFPTRVDGLKCLKESIARMYMYDALAKKLPIDTIKEFQRQGKTMDIMKILRELCIKY